MPTVEIRPPSVRAETLNVLKASGAIIALVAAYLLRPALFGGAGERASRPSDLLPFQSLVSDSPGGDQRMFRELQEGLLEAERVRAATGRWPDSATFANDGIPPFAPDPTRKDATYRWSTLVQGPIVNYVGVPTTVIVEREGRTEDIPADTVFLLTG